MLSPHFNDASLPHWLDNQSAELYDTLPFGVVQMDSEGKVTAYSKVQSAISGVSKDHALGKHFFTQVAPCTNNFMVAERYRQDTLDEVLPYMFTYITQPTPVELRLIKGTSGFQYLLAKNA